MTSPMAVTNCLRDASGVENVRSLQEFIRSSGLRSIVLGSSKDLNAKVTILLVSPASARAVLAVKAPTTDAAARAIEAEANVLTALSNSKLEKEAATIPRLVEVVEFDGRPAAVMTAVEGSPMSTEYLRWRHTATPAKVAGDLTAAGSWLARFQQRTERGLKPVEMDAGVTEGLRARFSEEENLNADLAVLADLHARLRRYTTPTTGVHGDFWFGNLLLREGTVSGVVDWESGAASGEPLRDLARFAVVYALYLDTRPSRRRRVAGHPGLHATRWGAGVEYALNGTGWFPDLFARFLRDGLTRLGASSLDWRDVAVSGVAEIAALTDDQEFARRNLDLFRRLALPSERQEQLAGNSPGWSAEDVPLGENPGEASPARGHIARMHAEGAAAGSNGSRP